MTRLLANGNLAIATFGDNLINIVDITTGELLRSINAGVQNLAALTDGNLAVGTVDG